jgi:hypothetical protein
VESGENEMIGDIRDLYSISLEGQITRLTYLTSVFDYVRERGSRASSDGRYIAFWLWAYPYKDNFTYLSVLDTTTGKITDTCIPGYLQVYYPIPPDPIWSPTGHQLVVEVHDNPDDQDYFCVVLVDLDKGFAAQIAENMMVWDWMLNSP